MGNRPSRHDVFSALRRGRDLFDLYWALTNAKPAVDPAAVVESFRHYLKQEGARAGRAEFVGILDSHLADRGFCTDMNQLLRAGVSYNPQEAGQYLKSKLLSLLPKQSSNGDPQRSKARGRSPPTMWPEGARYTTGRGV